MKEKYRAPSDDRSRIIAETLAMLDTTFGNDYFDFRFGGDGDNGEELVYLFDIMFDVMKETMNESDTATNEEKTNITSIFSSGKH